MSPSSYFDGPLLAYERFCIDEAALIVLAEEKKKYQDEMRAEAEAKGKGGTNPSEEPKYADLSTFNALQDEATRARKQLQKEQILAR